MDKLALGIYLDGLSLKAALVSNDHGFMQIERLESFKLFDALDQDEDSSKSIDEKGRRIDNVSNDDDPFGIDFDVRPAQNDDVAQALGNIDVVIELLSKLAPPGCPIAFNLQASKVHYKVIHADESTSKIKLKKHLWQELNQSSEEEINLQNAGVVKINESSFLGIIHKDSLAFSSILGEASKLMNRQQHPLSLIDTNEFALADYIAKTTNLSEAERSAVVFFSQNFTQIFFMKGGTIENVLPTIHTGARSSTICETAFSKILYEFDFKGIDSPQTIFLVGEVDQVKGVEFFSERFANLNIVKIETDESTLTSSIREFAGNTSPFCMAIALAMKTLQPKKSKNYKLNFVPKRIRDKQSQFVVAWHGFAMLAMLFLTILFIFTQNIKLNNDINKTRNSIKTINEKLDKLSNVEHDVDSLRLEISNIEKGTALIDSLSEVTTRWTPLIESFSDAIESVGTFTITKFESISKDRIVMVLNLSNEKQVALLERNITNSKVLSVINKASEDMGNVLELSIECNLEHQRLKKPAAAKTGY